MRDQNKEQPPTKRQRREAMARKKEERAQKAYYKKQKKAQSYLNEDEGYASFSAQLAQLGLQLRDITGDGNCLFRALGDQFDAIKNHLQHRQDTTTYMQNHREDFEPFVEDDVPFDRHLSNLKKAGTYAGNDAIVAFARLHKVNIVIHQLNSPCWEIRGSDDEKARQLHISYHNGDHYSSVRKIGDNSSSPPNIRIQIADSPPSWQQKQQQEAAEYEEEEEEEEEEDWSPVHTEMRGEDLFGDVCDLEDRVMQETGCKNRPLVRQALEDTGFSMDEAVLYTLQLMSTMPQHQFLDEVDGMWAEATSSSPSSSSGAKPKKGARQSAKEKKLEKKKRATMRHKNKVADGQYKPESNDDDSEEDVLIHNVSTLKI